MQEKSFQKLSGSLRLPESRLIVGCIGEKDVVIMLIWLKSATDITVITQMSLLIFDHCPVSGMRVQSLLR